MFEALQPVTPNRKTANHESALFSADEYLKSVDSKAYTSEIDFKLGQATKSVIYSLVILKFCFESENRPITQFKYKITLNVA